ncbi:MAG: hypothetical protein H6645_05755 [Caldilineaceae bacterium]|nr:hypothetical protein [Caldilineaceae bacterium]
MLANDSDPDGDSLTVGDRGPPQHGAATRKCGQYHHICTSR